MNTQSKKQLHHAWTYVRAIKPIYLLVAFALFGAVSVLALRANNQTMLEYREAVFTADERGGDVEGALRDLRLHVYGHMNTSLTSGDNAVYPPIQLKHTYERLLAEAQTEEKQASERVYSEAQAECERRFPDSFSGGPRVPCIREYVESHQVTKTEIPDSLYKFDFVSPRWSPDLAGWSVVLTVITALLLGVRLLVPFILKRLDVL